MNRRTFVSLVLITFAILLGYHEVFKGADFFVHQDQELFSYFSFGNTSGNGWRPDKSFGISTFYGDTITHAWSGFTFWDRLFSSRKTAYVASIVFLDLISAIVIYFLLKTVAPKFGRQF